MYSMSSNMALFNADHGFNESLVRGMRNCILKAQDYENLIQCESLEDVKMHLCSTDYGNFLANEPVPLSTSVIRNKCREKLVNEFRHIRLQASEPLATFMDYITYAYMIDNVILLVTGTLHGRDAEELLEKCHPLGKFDQMKVLTKRDSTAEELYDHVLIDTPLAPFFTAEGVEGADLNETHIEILRNTLFKSYIESFAGFCASIGGITAEIMFEILQFEADRRTINITLHSFSTEMTADARSKLFPSMGLLYPAATQAFAQAEDIDAARNIIDDYGIYRKMLSESMSNPNRTLEVLFLEHEVVLNRHSFDRQYHLGMFYSYLKLKEQEIRNIVWISECVAMNNKSRVRNFINIYE